MADHAWPLPVVGGRPLVVHAQSIVVSPWVSVDPDQFEGQSCHKVLWMKDLPTAWPTTWQRDADLEPEP